MTRKQAAFSNRKTASGQAQAPGGAGILKRVPLIILVWGLVILAGCSTGSTPLYYTSKSAIPSQGAPPAQVQAQAQTPPPAQMQQPAPTPQTQARYQPPAPAQAQYQAQQPPQVPASMRAPGNASPYAMQQPPMPPSAVESTSYRDYKVGPEDLLLIDVLGQEGLKRELRVNGVGQISMPLVGVINVAGLSTQQVEDRLREAYGSQYLRNPQINVEVKEFHHQRVAVTGAVLKPGYYDIIGPRTLLEVLSMAGGITNKPGPEAGDVIHVIQRVDTSSAALKAGYAGATQPQTRTTVINTQRLLSGQASELNLMVKNGDVVYVPFAGNAYVLGAVKKPTNVPVKENLTVSQAISLAQGIDPIFATYKITVMRFDEQGRPVRLEADLKNITAGKEADIPVKENDVIVVNEGELKTKLFVIRQLLPIPSGGYAIPTR
jgi:polysaccharide biosynthesis/export protein